eukprot:1847178-Amphidinium_carterae.1
MPSTASVPMLFSSACLRLENQHTEHGHCVAWQLVLPCVCTSCLSLPFPPTSATEDCVCAACLHMAAHLDARAVLARHWLCPPKIVPKSTQTEARKI